MKDPSYTQNIVALVKKVGSTLSRDEFEGLTRYKFAGNFGPFEVWRTLDGAVLAENRGMDVKIIQYYHGAHPRKTGLTALTEAMEVAARLHRFFPLHFMCKEYPK